MKHSVLQFAIFACAVATVAGAEDQWMEKVRKLQVAQFMQVCNQVFMNDMPHSSYLMSDFSRDVGNFCGQFATKKSICPNGGFRSLQLDFQDAFFRHASQHMGTTVNRFPMSVFTSMGDTGYIVSDKTKPELDAMKNDLCIQMQTAFGGSVQFPQQVASTGSPTTLATDNPTTSPVSHPSPSPTRSLTESPTIYPTVALRTVRPTNPTPKHTGTDLFGQDTVSQQQNDLDTLPTPVYKEDSTLSVFAIIGIAIAVTTVLGCFFYFEARRRNLSRQVGILAAANSREKLSDFGKTTLDMETAKPQVNSTTHNPTNNKSKLSTSTRAPEPTFAVFEEIQEAVNNADWDNIYRLASLLAEEDEAQSLPGLDIPSRGCRRSHLNAEDQERTKTLDELMAKGDWTGLAVTAALYAGESSSSDDPTALQAGKVIPKKKTKKSLHHDEDDWKKVHITPLDNKTNSSSSLLSARSLHSTDIEQGRVPVDGLVKCLNRALDAGDWTQVNFYATKIKDGKGQNGSSSFVSGDSDQFDTLQMAGSSRAASNISIGTTETDSSRRQTIEKLILAEKWKGVSIMANLYDMESKQSQPGTVEGYGSRGKEFSSRPPRAERKPSRTKELRQCDRVKESIVEFKQQHDDGR